MSTSKNNKLKCIITGRQLIATKEYYARKVKKAGGEQQLHDTYVCREAKNLLKQGTSVDKIRQVLNVDTSKVGDVSQEIISEVLSSKNNAYRKVNIFNTTSNLLNFKTDPDVQQLIKNLKNEQSINSHN